MLSSLPIQSVRRLLPVREGRDDGQASDRDQHPISVTLLVTLLFGGLAMLYSLVLFRFQVQWEHGLRADSWFQGGDVWMAVDGGRFVWHGALGYVYMGSGQSYSLPLSYILIAPISALIDHFHLVEGLVPLLRPSAWPLVASFMLATNVFVLDAVRRLSWDLGMRKGLWRVQVATLLVVCVPGFEYGHFEDVLAIAFLLHAVRYLLADRPLLSGLLLSLSISCKQWAVLAVPLIVLATPKGRRMLSVICSSALPLLFAAVVLGTDAKHGFKALLSPTNPKRTDPGHLSFFYTWFGAKTSRATRTISVALSPVVAYLFRRAKRPAALLGVLSALLLIRPLFEPMVYPYYWMPALLVAGLVGVAAHGRLRIRDWSWQVLAIVWSLPASNPSTNGLWWGIELTLICLTLLQVASNCGVLPSPRPVRAKPSATTTVPTLSNAAQRSTYVAQ